jgi:hypothetical protein
MPMGLSAPSVTDGLVTARGVTQAAALQGWADSVRRGYAQTAHQLRGTRVQGGDGAVRRGWRRKIVICNGLQDNVLRDAEGTDENSL